MLKEICRVCGYEYKNFNPWGEDQNIPSHEICDCCGIEFGCEDVTKESTLRARSMWIEGGYKWFNTNAKPKDWDPLKQLRNIPKEFLGKEKNTNKNMELNEAKKIAEDYIKEMNARIKASGGGHEAGLLDDETIELDKYFIFFYNSEEYIKTRDQHEMLLGPGPIIIGKQTGKMYVMGSAFSWQIYIDNLEKYGSPYPPKE